MLPPDRWPDVERLFRAALAAEEADADPEVLLADADDEVATEVRTLLAAENAADAFFARAPDLLPASDNGPDADAGGGLPAGTRLGPWEVEAEIGRGGMGTVYRARRADGLYAQTVAVKVVHRGMDTERIVRRFQQERTLLASLAHEGVARLIDGGVADDGRPYLAMELVAGGAPLTAYCDARRLPVEARLRLFLDVCDAVAHAHRRLVVHRDLKPSNILVADDDAGRPRVKLLDFGIARLLDADADALTVPEMRLFTPRYAAPEQAGGDAPVTTAADVYSLGAVLYELLAGDTPPATHTGAATAPRPSSALTAAAPAQRQAVAEARAAGADRLGKALRGDLDAICQRALRPEPEARYPSADALADDVRRHLGGLPVRARAGTRRYVATSFLRRHRWGVGTAAALLAVVVGSAGVVAVQSRRVVRERDRAEEVARVLENVLLRIDPGGQQGASTSVRDLLDLGAEETEKMEDAEAKAHLLDVMARVYRALADYRRALPMHEQAVRLYTATHGADAPETLAAEHHLAYLLAQMGRPGEAETRYRRVLERRRQTGDPTGLVESTSDLADLYLAEGRPAEARPLLEEGLAVLARHPDAGPPDLSGPIAQAGFYYQLGVADQHDGRLADAARQMRRAHALYRQHRGPDHVFTAAVETRLGGLLAAQGQADEAQRLLRHALAVQERTWGPEHPWTLSALFARADAFARAGRTDSARLLYRDARTRAEAAGDTLRAQRARRSAAALP